MKTSYIFWLAFVFWKVIFYSGINAQHYCTIQGIITNSKNEPLPYANVFFKDRFEGAVSDDNGRYNLKIDFSGKASLICTYIGYTSFEQDIQLAEGETVNLNIVLTPTEVRGQTVQVTASAFTAADEDGVTLTSMDVVRTPGAAADIFWAIKSLPGLQQVEDGAGLFVRGGDVSETVLLLDGAVINHPYKYESPTGGYFGTFNPFLLKGTFFSSGGFSAQYGNALSGALAMESLDMPDRRFIGVGIGLAAESAYITFPLIENKLGVSFSGNRSNTKMLFELNNSRKDFSQYPRSYDLNLNMNLKSEMMGDFKLFIFREDDEVGVEVDDPDYLAYFNGSTSNQFYNLKWSRLAKKNVLIHGNIAWSNFDRTMQLSVMELDVNDRLYQGRIMCEYDLSKNITMRAGCVVFNQRTNITGKVPQEELDLTPNAATDHVSTRYSSYRAAQFIELQFPTFLGIQFTPGVRNEYESISTKNYLDPRLSCIYPLTATSNLTAAVGIYHQYPDPSYYDPYIGNPQLMAMSAVHYIFGYAYQEDNRIFRIESYYKDYHKLLLDDETFNYLNDGYGYAGGVDLFAKNSYGPISGWISYSWLRAKRKWLDLPKLVSPYFDITHNATMVMNINLPQGISIGASYRFATGKPYTPAPERFNEARVPDYQKWDITLTYLYSFFQNNMTVFYAAVSNLFGRNNIFDYRYSRDYKRRDAVESSLDRSVYFGMSFNM